MKKFILASTLVLVLGSLTVWATSSTKAFDLNRHTDLINRLASAFGKSPQEVQTVFDQYRTDLRATRQHEFEDRLNQAETNGKITAQQKQLILEKHQQLIDSRPTDLDSWQNLSRSQRRQQALNRHQEIKSWADQNGIDLSILGPLFGPKDGPHMGGPAF